MLYNLFIYYLINALIYWSTGVKERIYISCTKFIFEVINIDFWQICILFHMKITVIVIKSSQEDSGLCYFFFWSKLTSCSHCCFPQQIRPQVSVQSVLVWKSVNLHGNWISLIGIYNFSKQSVADNMHIQNHFRQPRWIV